MYYPNLPNTPGLDDIIPSSYDRHIIAPELLNRHETDTSSGLPMFHDDINMNGHLGHLSPEKAPRSAGKQCSSAASKSTPPGLISDHTPPLPAKKSKTAAPKRRGRPPKRLLPSPEETTSRASPKRRRRQAAHEDHGNEKQEENEDEDDENDEAVDDGKPAPKEARQDPRRARIREKNRIAASKCRNKQRKAVSQLTIKHDRLENLHGELCKTLNDLEAEAYMLKNMLMAHGTCGCQLIQQYFRDVATDLMQKMNSSAAGGPGVK